MGFSCQDVEFGDYVDYMARGNATDMEHCVWSSPECTTPSNDRKVLFDIMLWELESLCTSLMYVQQQQVSGAPVTSHIYADSAAATYINM